MALGFAITPEQRRAFEADQWAQPHLNALADDWERQQLERLNQDVSPPAPVQTPTPSDTLTNPLGNAGPETETPTTGASTAPSPAAMVPEQPAPAPSLPAPDAPPPTDFGPVPQRTSAQRPLQSPSAVSAPTPAPTPLASGDLVSYARQAAQRAGIDPDLFVRQINQESGFVPGKVSPAGARGIAQIVPRWHPGVNPDDPTAALDYAANLMSGLIKQYGDVRTALVAYNGGGGAVQALKAGTPYAESVDYVNKITGGGSGQPVTASLSQGKQDILNKVAPFLGNSYVWGGKSPDQGWDCSGLAGYLTTGQAESTTTLYGKSSVVTQDQAQPGDLVFWNMNSSDPHMQHVGVYLGDGRVVQSGGNQSSVNIGSINQAIGSAPEFRRVGGSVDTASGSPAQAVAPPGAPTPDESPDAIKQPVRQSPDETVSNPFGEAFRQVGAVKDQIGGGIGAKVAGVQSPETGNPVLDALGTGASALGTVASTVGEGVRNITPTSELARGATGMEQIVSENRGLYDQQQRLVDEFAGAQARGDEAAMQRIRTEMDTLQAQLPDARNRDVLHAAAERNPSTGLIEAGANLAGAAFAAPLVAEGAPLAARAVASAIDPMTGLPSLAGRLINAATSPEFQNALRARQRAEIDPTFASGGLGKLVPERQAPLPVEQAVSSLHDLEQRWTELDNMAAAAEARSSEAFNPGLKQRYANEAARHRAEQEAVMQKSDYLIEHGNLPPDTATALPEMRVSELPPAEPSTGSAVSTATSPSAVRQSAILSSPNYRRLVAMRGTAEQQGALRQAEEGFAGNINLEKITPDAVKSALQRTMDSPSTAEFAGQRRGVITDTQAMENAAQKALSMSPQDWIKTRAGRAFNQEEALALGNQLVRTGNEYEGMRAALATREAAGEATDLERAAVADKSLEFALLEGVRSGVAAEAGRALRSFRQVLDGSLQTKNGDTSKAFRAALKTLGGEDAYAEWVQRWSALDPSDQIGKYAMLQALHQPTRMQKLLAWTTSNMLSGTKTLEVNLTGGAVETLNRPVIELLGGRPGDAWTDITAMGRAVGEAWGNAGTTLSTGIRPSRAATALADPTKYDAIRPEAFAGKTGLIATPALRIMSATDEFMRTLNAAGGLAVAARREARATGKTVQEVLSQPPEHVLKFAQNAADAAVFEGQGSPVSKALIAGRNLIHSDNMGEKAVGVAANVLFPFVHIPEQILIRGTRMLPGVNEASTILKIRKGLQSGDQQTVRDAIARYVLTDAILAATWSQVSAGNITGMGPKDAQKRAALDAARDASGNKVWQAHSIKVGDRWIDYTNLGPVAIPLAALSNANEAYLDSGKKPDANVAADVFNRVAATMLDATYIKSFGDVMKAVSEGNLVKAGGSLIGNTATRFVPYGGAFAQAERSIDQETKDPRNLPEYVASRVPGASELVPDKPSPFGGSVQQPQDLLANALPFKTSAPGAPDLVAKAFTDAGVGAPGAPPQIRIRSQLTGSLSPPIVLTDDEKKRYVQIMGDRLREQVTPMVSDPGWSNRTIQSRQAAIEGRLQAARDYAEIQIYRSLPEGDRTRRMNEGRQSLTPQPIR